MSSGLHTEKASQFALLGTGSSASVPWLHCVISPGTACVTCTEALQNPLSLNRRNNPSAVLSHSLSDGRRVNILIDCGKTFRDAVLRNFRTLGIDHLGKPSLCRPDLPGASNPWWFCCWLAIMAHLALDTTLARPPVIDHSNCRCRVVNSRACRCFHGSRRPTGRFVRG